jgi:L-alanine-DL-glutamate epimerase-like enolase superfamily enzyme
MNLKYKKSDLPFKHPFTISKGTKTHQPALLVELEFFGIKGYGEAPAITYYNISVEKMIADLELKKILLKNFPSLSLKDTGIIFIIFFLKTLSWSVRWIWPAGIFMEK